METFTLQDPTGDFTFTGTESSAWFMFAQCEMARNYNLSFFDWCVQNLQQVTLYV